jgi:predicted nucleic acid-binding protein
MNKQPKSWYAHNVLTNLFGALLRSKEITEEEIENVIDEIMETVSIVAAEYGENLKNECV